MFFSCELCSRRALSSMYVDRFTGIVFFLFVCLFLFGFFFCLSGVFFMDDQEIVAKCSTLLFTNYVLDETRWVKGV